MDDVLVRARTRARFPAANVALFLATIVTTIWAGFLESPLASSGVTLERVIAGGLPFAAALVGILLAHEMGHYVLARRHGVDATLPYFIPVPFGIAGTLGAIIRIRSALPSRRAALEIAAAGPIAGFLLAVPLLCWGLAHSEVQEGAGFVASFPAAPYHVLEAWLGEERAVGFPSGVKVFGDSLVTIAAQRLVLGELPEGAQVIAHPVAVAAWIGLLVTTLNLVPIGQLDGGHVLYALLGRRRARLAGEVVSFGLLVAGVFVSWTWLVWWVLTRFLMGVAHPPALREEPLCGRHRALALASLLLFVVTFIPVPIAF